MKKIKLVAALALASTVLFTGCASSFSEAIGNVTEEALQKSSLLTYNGHTISEKMAKFVTLLEEYKVESSTLQADSSKLYSGELWNEDSIKTTKDRVISQLKDALVISANAKNYGVELTDFEKTRIEHTVKTQLGQTYRNVLVEFFADKGLPITEELLTEFLTMNALADKVQGEVMNKIEVNQNIEHAVSYSQLIIPINNNPEGAKATADKIKEELDAQKSIDDIVKENGITKIDGIEVKDIPSTNVNNEIRDAILGMSKDENRIFEFKSGDTLVAYYVVKINDVDSDETKTKAQQTNLPILKQSKAMELINSWINEVKTNESVLDNVSFKVNPGFWKKFDDGQVEK